MYEFEKSLQQINLSFNFIFYKLFEVPPHKESRNGKTQIIWEIGKRRSSDKMEEKNKIEELKIKMI